MYFFNIKRLKHYIAGGGRGKGCPRKGGGGGGGEEARVVCANMQWGEFHVRHHLYIICTVGTSI